MKQFNENVYSFLSVIAAVTLAYFAGQATIDNLQIVAVKSINVALLLGTSFGFYKALKGTKYDVISEIFDNKNVAASIFAVGYAIAIAMALTVVS